MSASDESILIAADVGNSRIKLAAWPASVRSDPLQRLEDRGRGPDRLKAVTTNFAAGERSCCLPPPTDRLAVDASETDLGKRLTAWLGPPGRRREQWLLAGVNPPALQRLAEATAARAGASLRVLTHNDLPLQTDLESPETTGIDRLLAAVAANARRQPGQACIVIDAGSATTVNYISQDGVFRGGAILPGLSMSARALHDDTAALPLIDVTGFDQTSTEPLSGRRGTAEQSAVVPAERAEPVGVSPPPAPIGRSTVRALRAGIFWTQVGGIATLVTEMLSARRSPPYEGGVGGGRDATPPLILLTGGAAPPIAGELARQCNARGLPVCEHAEDLVLEGIATVTFLRRLAPAAALKMTRRTRRH